MFTSIHYNGTTSSKASRGGGAKSSPHVLKRCYFNYQVTTHLNATSTHLDAGSPFILYRGGGGGRCGGGGGGGRSSSSGRITSGGGGGKGGGSGKGGGKGGKKLKYVLRKKPQHQHQTHNSLYHSNKGGISQRQNNTIVPNYSMRPWYSSNNNTRKYGPYGKPFSYPALLFASLYLVYCIPSVGRAVERESIYATTNLPLDVIEHLQEQQQQQETHIKNNPPSSSDLALKSTNTTTNTITSTADDSINDINKKSSSNNRKIQFNSFLSRVGSRSQPLFPDLFTKLHPEHQQEQQAERVITHSGRPEALLKGHVPLSIFKNVIAVFLCYHLLPQIMPNMNFFLPPQPVYADVPTLSQDQKHYTAGNSFSKFVCGALAGIVAETSTYTKDTYIARNAYNDRPLLSNHAPYLTPLDATPQPSLFKHLMNHNNNNSTNITTTNNSTTGSIDLLKSKCKTYYSQHYKNRLQYANAWAAVYYGGLFSFHDYLLDSYVVKSGDVLLFSIISGVFSGGIAGFVAHPFDCMKRKMQVHALTPKQIITHCGIYDGLCAGVVDGGVVAGAVRGGLLFGIYEILRHAMHTNKVNNGEIKEQPLMSALLSSPSLLYQQEYTLPILPKD